MRAVHDGTPSHGVVPTVIHADAAPTLGAKRRTILVVDDSETMRNVMSVYLMGRGFDLVMVEDAERALRLLRLMKIDLVISDVNMPSMDGITFASHVRRGGVQGMATVPFILMTGDRSADLESRAVMAGVDAFLRKPLDSVTVIDTINRVLPRTDEDE